MALLHVIPHAALMVGETMLLIVTLLKKKKKDFTGFRRFWGPAPTLSSFFTLHDPKVIARFLRECFEHRNTLIATQTGHSL